MQSRLSRPTRSRSSRFSCLHVRQCRSCPERTLTLPSLRKPGAALQHLHPGPCPLLTLTLGPALHVQPNLLSSVAFAQCMRVFSPPKMSDGLRRLTALGYGAPFSGLPLYLVYSPQGPDLPSPQAVLEADYRRILQAEHSVVFNQLLTLANLPVGSPPSMAATGIIRARATWGHGWPPPWPRPMPRSGRWADLGRVPHPTRPRLSGKSRRFRRTARHQPPCRLTQCSAHSGRSGSLWGRLASKRDPQRPPPNLTV